jgi:uncharacterized repeat protein (TIGR03803 family)
MKRKLIVVLWTLAMMAEAQTFKVLYRFNGGRDAANPMTSVVLDSHGIVYGPAGGGALNNAQGTLYSVGAKESVVHRFKGKDGSTPLSPLVSDGTGGWYGTTRQGGGMRFGEVFHLVHGVLTSLHAFTGKDDGGWPAGAMVLDVSGNLYGVNTRNGRTVWKIDGQGAFTTLFTFHGTDEGGGPSGLILDSTRNVLFSVTAGGGTSRRGVVYQMDFLGAESVLYNFQGGSDGSLPIGSLVEDTSGNLYGATSGGGDPVCQCGTIFRVDQQGQETVLHKFKGGTDGVHPKDGLVMDAASNLYGTTYSGGKFDAGTVFKVDVKAHHTILHSFTGKSDGALPVSGLAMDLQGSLYGTTVYGGNLNKCQSTGGCGVVFKITP